MSVPYADRGWPSSGIAKLKTTCCRKATNEPYWSLFVEDRWRLRQECSRHAGRPLHGHHDTLAAGFSPRAYLVQDATTNWTLPGQRDQG